MVRLIWAQAHDRVIGADGAMPWHLPEDLAHFRRATTGSAVVMGRATWEALEPAYRPLPGRRNIVLTRRPDYVAEGAELARSLPAALAAAGPDGWVIGGAEVLGPALEVASELVVTDIDLAVDGDTRAPRIDPARWAPAVVDPPEGWHTSTTGLRYRFTTYHRR